MIKAEINKQLIVSVENRIGALAEATSIVAESGINLIAVCAYVVGTTGFIAFVTEDNKKTANILKSKKYDVREEEILLVSVDNKPGTLEEITGKIASAGIDLTFLYGSAEKKGKTTKLVIVSENNKLALAAIQS